jgi:hypothetical protein
MEVSPMDDMGSKRDDIVGTTDYLEAITVFKTAKNFLFVITVLALVLLLACFFLANSRYAKYDSGAVTPPASMVGLAKDIEKLAAVAAVQVGVVSSDQPAVTEANVPRSAAMTKPMASGTAEAKEPAQPAVGEAKAPVKLVKVKFEWIAWTVRVSDFAAIVSVSLYSLILVFCMKVSLVGRLGGINHIARAFVWSLVALVFILPWQNYFGGVLAGAVFTASELKDACTMVGPRDVLEQVFFYVRFAGLPAAVILMMLAAQIRSVRWAKATLRRLGVM